MKIISRLRDQRYCAFCRSPRRLYVKKHVDMTNVLALIFLAVAVTAGVWGGPDPRGLLLFCVFVGIGEIFIYLRWRASLICRMCGFDPIVYKKSPSEAAKRVNTFFREQAENPGFWLTNSPLLDVHRRLREQERKRLEIQAVSRKSPRSSASSATGLMVNPKADEKSSGHSHLQRT